MITFNVPFDPHEICTNCGDDGAFLFDNESLCDKCARNILEWTDDGTETCGHCVDNFVAWKASIQRAMI